jgi:hypothetical protein
MIKTFSPSFYCRWRCLLIGCLKVGAVDAQFGQRGNMAGGHGPKGRRKLATTQLDQLHLLVPGNPRVEFLGESENVKRKINIYPLIER